MINFVRASAALHGSGSTSFNCVGCDILVLGMGGNNVTHNIPTVNGQPMTQVRWDNINNKIVGMFIYLNPPQTTCTIAQSCAPLSWAVTGFSGGNTLYNSAAGEGNGTSAAVWVGTTAGSLAVDCAIVPDGTSFVVGSGQTQIVTDGSRYMAMSYIRDDGATYRMNWTWGNTKGWIIGALSLIYVAPPQMDAPAMYFIM